MKALHLTVVSPEKELFSGEVQQVTLPGSMGSFTILSQHAPIISSLQQGTLVYVTASGEEQSIELKSGFVEMSYNQIDVCVE